MSASVVIDQQPTSFLGKKQQARNSISEKPLKSVIESSENLSHSSDYSDDFCAECGGILVQTVSDAVCPSCAIVVHPVYTEPHSSMYPDPEKNICHLEISDRSWLYDDSGSFIDYRGAQYLRTSQGKPLPSHKQRDFYRQKRLHEVYTSESEKIKFRTCFEALSAIVGVLELSDATKADAARLIRASRDQLKRKIFVVEFVAGAIYLSLRTNSNRTLRVEHLFHVCEALGYPVRDPHKILKAAALIRKETQQRQLRVLKPTDYFDTILSQISQDKRLIKRLDKKNYPPEDYFQDIREPFHLLLKKLSLERRVHRKPFVLASAALAGADIYLAQVRHKKIGFLSQDLLAQVLGVSIFTLREHYQKVIRPILFDILKLLEPQKLDKALESKFQLQQSPHPHSKLEEKKTYNKLSDLHKELHHPLCVLASVHQSMRSQKRGRNVREKLIAALTTSPEGLTSTELARLVGRKQTSLYYHLNLLVVKGLIEKLGTRNVRYQLKRKEMETQEATLFEDLEKLITQLPNSPALELDFSSPPPVPAAW